MTAHDVLRQLTADVDAMLASLNALHVHDQRVVGKLEGLRAVQACLASVASAVGPETVTTSPPPPPLHTKPAAPVKTQPVKKTKKRMSR